MEIHSIAVFCGSQNGNNPLYQQHTYELGKILSQKEITMVYGGGSVGLMGVIADSMLHHQGHVIGVIPQILVDRERQHRGIEELHVTEDMHSRKRKMYELCDAAVILPGGFGTLDELFEMLTWNQLAIQEKKIFILNTDGFYEHLILHIENMQDTGFLYGQKDKRFTILQSPADLLNYL